MYDIVCMHVRYAAYACMMYAGNRQDVGIHTLNFVIKETIVIKETPCGACKVKVTCPIGHVQFGAKCPYGRVKAQVYMPRRTCSFSLRAQAGV